VGGFRVSAHWARPPREASGPQGQQPRWLVWAPTVANRGRAYADWTTERATRGGFDVFGRF
jgi:hypothetical protein